MHYAFAIVFGAALFAASLVSPSPAQAFSDQAVVGIVQGFARAMSMSQQRRPHGHPHHGYGRPVGTVTVVKRTHCHTRRDAYGEVISRNCWQDQPEVVHRSRSYGHGGGYHSRPYAHRPPPWRPAWRPTPRFHQPHYFPHHRPVMHRPMPPRPPMHRPPPPRRPIYY